MKYFLTLTVCILLSLGSRLAAQPNAIDKYFQQYLEDERFTVVYISPRVFKMLDKLDLEDLDMDDEEALMLKEVAKDLQGLRILTSDENGAAFYAEAKKKIDTRDYEVLMTVRQKNDDNVDFLIRENEQGNIEELLLLAGGPDSFALLSFVGHIDLEKVIRFAKAMDKRH